MCPWEESSSGAGKVKCLSQNNLACPKWEQLMQVGYREAGDAGWAVGPGVTPLRYSGLIALI